MGIFVLVHGGGHGGWCYKRIASLLRAAGHEVYAPTLTGLGERKHLLGPQIDLDTHVTDIANVLEYEDLAEVILVGHSYGGMVITGVADRAPGRVGHLVFLDAAHPRNGESLADLSPGMMAWAHRDMRVVDGVELVLWPDSAAVEAYGVTNPDDVAWIKPKLTPHPWKCFTQKLRLADEAAVRRIPRTCINCTATLGVRPADKLERAFDGDHVFEIDTGHDLMITAPRATADMLLQVAAFLRPARSV